MSDAVTELVAFAADEGGADGSPEGVGAVRPPFFSPPQLSATSAKANAIARAEDRLLPMTTSSTKERPQKGPYCSIEFGTRQTEFTHGVDRQICNDIDESVFIFIR